MSPRDYRLLKQAHADRSRRLCSEWNKKHGAGARVLYRASLDTPGTIPTRTISHAFVNLGGDAVLFVEGNPGHVRLEAVETA